jgi:hypothetical protein
VEALICFLESHSSASQKKGKNMYFFLPRKAQICFSRRHRFASARGTVAPLRKGKKYILPVWFFHEKRFVETYQHGIYFEDLDCDAPDLEFLSKRTPSLTE